MAIQKLDSINLGLDIERDEIRDILADNFGDSLHPSFDRVRFPTSGSGTFSVPGVEGEEYPKELEGVVILHHPARAYWAGDYSGSQPPDCSSVDGKLGVGNPGGDCAKCPLNQWGSDASGSGRGKACKEMHRLYLVRSGEALPMILTIPPTSITNYRDYANRLTRSRLSIRGVVTRIGLAREKNANAIEFSKATFLSIGALDANSKAAIRDLAAELEPYIYQVPVADNEYGDIPPSAPPRPSHSRQAPSDDFDDMLPPDPNLTAPITADQRQEISVLLREKNLSRADAISLMERAFGVKESNDMSFIQTRSFIQMLKGETSWPWEQGEPVAAAKQGDLLPPVPQH